LGQPKWCNRKSVVTLSPIWCSVVTRRLAFPHCHPLKAEPGSDDGGKRGGASGCAAQRMAVRHESGREAERGSLFPAGFSEAVSREESAAGWLAGKPVVS
jgi:hypothetical protein